MFYEVKIKKPDGTLKEVITADQLDKLYWSNFYKSEDNIGLVTAPKPQVPSWVKEKLDVSFPDTYEIKKFIN